MNIKVITAGNCMMCGEPIKIVTRKDNNKIPNIFFCPRCEKRRKEKPNGNLQYYGNVGRRRGGGYK